jgi:enoyl-CoA hydratase/carnithine racemase
VESGGIGVERAGAVFVLRMQAGENRLNLDLLRAFDAALDQVETCDGDAALVTVGEGKFYSNGLDLERLLGGGGDEARETMSRLHALLARLLGFPRVTVAAVNGHAFAAGAMLATAHDFRIMRSDRGFFCIPEIDLATGHGLTPGMTALLAARLPAPVLHEAIVTGRRYPASEAVERGIVNEAQPRDQVLPRAIEMAGGLADKHRATLAALKSGLFARALDALRSGG